MIFGYLANMVAIIPSWITMIVNQPDLDVAPVGGPTMKPERFETSAEFVRALDRVGQRRPRRLGQDYRGTSADRRGS